jgi:hypothetical protein
MDFLVDKLRFLGLNEREVKVFTTISAFGRMKMTKIAARSGLPRTTVDAIEKHYEYSVELNRVADTLDWLENRLRPRNTLEKEIDTVNDEKIVINKDTYSIESSFKERSGDRTRILIARTPDGLDDAHRRINEYVGHAAATGTKLEMLVCSQVADAVQKRGVGTVTWKDPNLIRLNVVPAAYCAFHADTIIFPDRVLIRDIYSGAVQGIRGDAVVETMKHLLSIASETGWSVNVSAWCS